jgi:hypothetical protein
MGYICQINQGIAEAVTSVLGGAQFSSCPFYYPRSSCCRFGHPRETAVCARNFPDSNGISDYFKRRKHSHHTEPVPTQLNRVECGIIRRLEVHGPIYVLAGYARAKQAGRTTVGTLEESLRRNGRTVIFTSLILALGFWSGLVGSFKPTLYFSFLMGLTLLFDLLADLLGDPGNDRDDGGDRTQRP